MATPDPWRTAARPSAQFAVHAAERNDSGGSGGQMSNRAIVWPRLLSVMLVAISSAAALQAQGRAGAPPRDTTDVIGKPGALTAIETSVLNAMSDRNIVAHLMLEDSTEAALNQSVAAIAHDTAVSDLANQLAADHARALELDRAVIPSLRGLPRLSPGDTADPRMLRMMDMRFRGLGPAPALDRTFVGAQLVHHVHLLNELGALRAIAMSAPVQQRIDSEMATVRTHLTRVQALARTMRLPSP